MTTAAATGWEPSAHPRDWHGRWAHKGSGVAGQAQDYIRQLSGQVQVRELNEYDVPGYERDRLDPLTADWTPEQADAVAAYADHSYEINNTARGVTLTRHRVDPATTAQRTRLISSAMRPLPDDLVLLRELKGRTALGDLSPGDVIADPGFSSTTLRPGRFASGRDDSTVLHILAPKGTPVVWAGRGEDELILDRNTPLVVISKRLRPGRERFVTDMNLLVLPREMTGAQPG